MFAINSEKKGNFEDFAGMASIRKLLVTGATSDIGFSLFREFMSRYPDTQFILASRNKEQLSSLVEKLDVQSRGKIQLVDLPMNTIDISKFVARIEGIDSAIVCQGTYGVLGHFGEVNLDEFLKSLFSQLESVIITLRALCNLKTQGLRVIVLAGGGASQAYEGLSEYGMVKTAIARLVETLSLEIPPEKLKINFLGPGPTYSSMVENVLSAVKCDAKIDDRILKSSKNLKFSASGISRSLINACEYLFSDSSINISGKFLSSVWDSPEQLGLISDDDSYTLRRVIPASQSE